MSNPKGIFSSSKKYISIGGVNIVPWNVLDRNKKATYYSFFWGMFQLVQGRPLTVHQDNVQALSCLPKKINKNKTYNFTVITSSFLEVKAVAGYILKSRSGAFFKMRVSWTRCYKYHINIIIKPFLGVKRNTLRSWYFLSTTTTNNLNHFFFFFTAKKIHSQS